MGCCQMLFVGCQMFVFYCGHALRLLLFRGWGGDAKHPWTFCGCYKF